MGALLGSARVLHILQEAGYRLTRPRRVVVEAVVGMGRKFTGGDIVAEVAAVDRSVGRATVFRTLDMLAALGVISRVQQADGKQGYVVCSQGHHHYAVCSQCGLVVELPGCPLGSEAESTARDAGFRLLGHRLEYYGVCRACQEGGAG